MTLYFYLLLFTLSFPLGASWDRRFKYAQNFKYLFPAIFITGTFFIVWDIIFTKNGVWGFSEVHASSIKFFYLPIEEWLFFIIIPSFRRSSKEKKFLKNLKKGDRIVTTSGVHARINDFDEKSTTCIIETMAGKLKIEKSAISIELSSNLKT